MQWREYLIPGLSEAYFEKYVSGFKNGEFLTACLSVILGSSINSRGCSSATFGGASGTDFFLSLNILVNSTRKGRIDVYFKR